MFYCILNDTADYFSKQAVVYNLQSTNLYCRRFVDCVLGTVAVVFLYTTQWYNQLKDI